MSTASKRTKSSEPLQTIIPGGTEVILWRQQFAAALCLSTRQFDTLVSEGKIPGPDGQWQGKRVWRQATVNAFVRSLTGDNK